MDFHVAIVGAGISGLRCARALVDTGLHVTVLEKSRSVGGRCATKRWFPHVVDHGAQYWTYHDPQFQIDLEIICPQDVLALTSSVVDLQGRKIPATGGQRYYHRHGNNALGAALARGVTIQHDSLVESIHPFGAGWRIGETFYDAVVMSCPWPQTAELLGFDPGLVGYEKVLTGLFAYEAAWPGLTKKRYGRLDRTGEENLAWSACENHKVGRIAEGCTVMVVQAGITFSSAQAEDDPEAWLPLLQTELEEAWKIPASTFREAESHRWRFARRQTPESLSPKLPTGLFVTGDSVCASRIEDVWQQGRQTAQDVLTYLNQRA